MLHLYHTKGVSSQLLMKNIFENLYYLVWDGRRGLEIRFGKLHIIVGGRGGHLHEIVVPGLHTAVTDNLPIAGRTFLVNTNQQAASNPSLPRPRHLSPDRAGLVSKKPKKDYSDNLRFKDGVEQIYLVHF